MSPRPSSRRDSAHGHHVLCVQNQLHDTSKVLRIGASKLCIWTQLWCQAVRAFSRYPRLDSLRVNSITIHVVSSIPFHCDCSDTICKESNITCPSVLSLTIQHATCTHPSRLRTRDGHEAQVVESRNTKRTKVGTRSPALSSDHGGGSGRHRSRGPGPRQELPHHK